MQLQCDLEATVHGFQIIRQTHPRLSFVQGRTFSTLSL